MLGLWFFDPLAVATNADRISVSLFYQVVAPAYPPAYADSQGTSPFDDTTGIAVIVLNDESLANMMVDIMAGTVDIVRPENKLKDSSATWPPSMIVHSAIVKKIFDSATPKALFIDFGFFDDRDPIATDEFARVLSKFAVRHDELAEFQACQAADSTDCERWARRAPIFLPRADASAPPHLKILAPLEAAVSSIVSTKYIGDDIATYNQYDLFDCALETPPGEPLRPAPSAALAMYSAGGKAPGFGVADCDAQKIPGRLSVYWSDWGDDENGRGSFSCRLTPKTVFGRLWRIFAVWYEEKSKAWSEKVLSIVGGYVPDKAGNPAESLFQDCPPHLSVSASDFLADKEGMMGAILDDRFVFYGGNFAMADDLIRPPTHNPIPGVYVHAMVLDNLLQKRTKPVGLTWLGFLLTLSAVFAAAFCSAITWAGLERITLPSAGGSTGGDAMFPSVRNRHATATQTRLRRWSGCVIVKSRAVVWSVIKIFAARKGPWRLRFLASPYERFCFWVSQRRRLIHMFALILARIFVIAVIVCRGILLCFVAIGALAAIGFFWFDLAPINYVGIFSFVGLHALVRGVRSIRELRDMLASVF